VAVTVLDRCQDVGEKFECVIESRTNTKDNGPKRVTWFVMFNRTSYGGWNSVRGSKFTMSWLVNLILLLEI